LERRRHCKNLSLDAVLMGSITAEMRKLSKQKQMVD
jgi:hypothetical protein